MSDSLTLADDLLRGAREIAEHVFGSTSSTNVRRIYWLVNESRFPAFKLGGLLCARKSVLLRWVAEQEAHNERKRAA